MEASMNSKRSAEIITGILMALYQVGSFLIGPSTLHYIFFSIIEIAVDLLIVWFAWKLRNPEGGYN